MRKNNAKLTPLVLINGIQSILLIGFLATILPTQAASFDCAKASTKVEHIVCDNPDISKQDAELASIYKAALQDKTKAESVKQAQKQWLKDRNACSDVACVRNAYADRRQGLEVGTAGIFGKEASQRADANSQNGQQYHFQITKGKGVAVCDAYLVRLNTTKYEVPPYCDRPEDDKVKGFNLLNRVRVPATTVNDLYPIVQHFMLGANRETTDWMEMRLQDEIVSKHKGTPSAMQDWLNANSEWAKIWGYDPPVDIDNDGKPDNVESWHGSVLPHGIGGKECGANWEDKFPGLTSLRQPQVAFVITGKDRLDVQKTEQIFAHPAGGYRIYDSVNKEWKTSGDFRSIGTSIGIFEYEGVYYFDTFFDSWGDFENKRQKDKNIGNILGVFLNKDRKTRQVCEYLMTDIENQDGGK